MKPHWFASIALFALVGCGSGNLKQENTSLTEARKGFTTKIVGKNSERQPVDPPPPNVFQLVRFDAPVGKLAAYLSPDPKDGKKHPAIIWITGGDCNSICECWEPQPADNDQTASAFRKAGIIMMFPSLRGGNQNPGVKESFLGEVDDVLAAADFLAKEPDVDTSRMYLGGHSTGGTLVLLVSEMTDRFRAVFSFGPVDDVSGYGPQYLTYDTRNPLEAKLRSPGYWLGSIKSPTFIMEGASEVNGRCLRSMQRASTNPNIHFVPVEGATHFSILAPTTKLIAERILHDDGPACNLAFTPQEVSKLFGK